QVQVVNEHLIGADLPGNQPGSVDRVAGSLTADMRGVVSLDSIETVLVETEEALGPISERSGIRVSRTGSS
ncbi:MAG: hypothetical protein KDC03_11000, partial [Flavobacteriales bacterium]|nr:hypothetical protein [Flavobacteriales bacterium]